MHVESFISENCPLLPGRQVVTFRGLSGYHYQSNLPIDNKQCKLDSVIEGRCPISAVHPVHGEVERSEVRGGAWETRLKKRDWNSSQVRQGPLSSFWAFAFHERSTNHRKFRTPFYDLELGSLRLPPWPIPVL